MTKISLTKKIALVGMVAASSILTGCASYDRVGIMQLTAKDLPTLTEQFPDQKFSEPSQIIYTATGVPPVFKQDNLDKLNAFDYTDPNKVQNAAQLGTVVTSMGNPLAMVTNSMLIQMHKSQPTRLLRANQLITAIPFSGDFDKDANALHEMNIAIISNAYAANGTPVEFDHLVDGNTNGLQRFNPHYLIPKGLNYCDKSVEDFNDLNPNIHDFELCGTLLLNAGDVYYNNTTVETLPKGNFMISSTWLPDNFPVELLKSNNPYAYVYVPPFMYMNTNVYKDFSTEKVIELSRKGRFSLNPYMKNINSGEIKYFNKNLDKYQADNNSLIDEVKILSEYK